MLEELGTFLVIGRQGSQGVQFWSCKMVVNGKWVLCRARKECIYSLLLSLHAASLRARRSLWCPREWQALTNSTHLFVLLSICIFKDLQVCPALQTHPVISDVVLRSWRHTLVCSVKSSPLQLETCALRTQQPAAGR